jgi:hypothetical protein
MQIMVTFLTSIFFNIPTAALTLCIFKNTKLHIYFERNLRSGAFSLQISQRPLKIDAFSYNPKLDLRSS